MLLLPGPEVWTGRRCAHEWTWARHRWQGTSCRSWTKLSSGSASFQTSFVVQRAQCNERLWYLLNLLSINNFGPPIWSTRRKRRHTHCCLSNTSKEMCVRVYALALPIKQVFCKALLQGRLSNSIHNYSRGTYDALRKTEKQTKQVQCA